MLEAACLVSERSCSTSGPVTTRMGDCLRQNYLVLYPTTHINSVFHPSGVGNTRYSINHQHEAVGDVLNAAYALTVV